MEQINNNQPTDVSEILPVPTNETTTSSDNDVNLQETGETSPDNDNGDETSDPITDEELAKMIAQAEERGYLRGKNERIAVEMERQELPDIFSDTDEDAEELLILRRLRSSNWERGMQ